MGQSVVHIQGHRIEIEIERKGESYRLKYNRQEIFKYIFYRLDIFVENMFYKWHFIDRTFQRYRILILDYDILWIDNR